MRADLDAARPAHDEGRADAFVVDAAAFEQQSVRDEEEAVVAQEDDDGIAELAALPQQAEDLPLEMGVIG